MNVAVLRHDRALQGCARLARQREELAASCWGPNTLIAYELVDDSQNTAQITIVSRQRGSVPCILTPDNGDNRNPSWFDETSAAP